MNCQYCGSIIGITAQILGDDDFCSPAHRRRFHGRLRKAFQQVDKPADSISPAGFLNRLRPGDHGRDFFISGVLAVAAPMAMPVFSFSIDAAELEPDTPAPEAESARQIEPECLFQRPVSTAGPRDALAEALRRLKVLRSDLEQRRLGGPLRALASA